jgi:hypothetical protein
MVGASQALEIRATIAAIGRRRSELFSLLSDGPSAFVASERISTHFQVTRELAEVVLDQQLKTLLTPENL